MTGIIFVFVILYLISFGLFHTLRMYLIADTLNVFVGLLTMFDAFAKGSPPHLGRCCVTARCRKTSCLYYFCYTFWP